MIVFIKIGKFRNVLDNLEFLDYFIGHRTMGEICMHIAANRAILDPKP